MTNAQMKQMLASGLSVEQISAVIDIFEPEAPSQGEPPAQEKAAEPSPAEPEAPAPAQADAEAHSLSDVLHELAALKSAVQAANRAGAQQPPPAEEENPFASLI